MFDNEIVTLLTDIRDQIPEAGTTQIIGSSANVYQFASLQERDSSTIVFNENDFCKVWESNQSFIYTGTEWLLIAGESPTTLYNVIEVETQTTDTDWTTIFVIGADRSAITSVEVNMLGNNSTDYCGFHYTGMFWREASMGEMSQVGDTSILNSYRSATDFEMRFLPSASVVFLQVKGTDETDWQGVVKYHSLSKATPDILYDWVLPVNNSTVPLNSKVSSVLYVTNNGATPRSLTFKYYVKGWLTTTQNVTVPAGAVNYAVLLEQQMGILGTNSFNIQETVENDFNQVRTIYVV